MDRFCAELPKYISQGWVLILKDMDRIYSILQDILNMRYTLKDGKYYSILIYDNIERTVFIHPETRIVVIQSISSNSVIGFDNMPKAQKVDTSAGVGQEASKKKKIGTDLAAPFQNRMEKYLLTHEILIPDQT